MHYEVKSTTMQTRKFRKLIFPGVILLSITAALSGQRPGIECGCTKYGNYVAPSLKDISAVSYGINLNEGYSSKYKYSVVVENATPPNLIHISVLYQNKVIFSESTRATGWGFSPDEDKFVMHGFDASGHHWCRLVNLDPDQSVEGENAIAFDVISPMTVSTSRIMFSPKGKYLVYSAITGSDRHLLLKVFDASNGNEVFDGSTTSIMAVPSSGKGIAGWGFSPDSRDATFVYAYITGVDRYTVIVKNMRAPADQYVVSGNNMQGDAKFYFSPCGEYFAAVNDLPGADPVCMLYPTAGGSSIGPASAAGWSKLFSSADGHYIGFRDQTSVKIADNFSNNTCPDTKKPWWENKLLDTGSVVTGTKIELHWNGAKDDNAVTAYWIYKNGEKIKETGSAKKFTVTGLKPSTSYNFNIEAGDEAGNWSIDGPSNFFTTFPDNPPVWSSPELHSTNTTETKTTLFWTHATDDYGIEYYRILKNGKEENKISGTLNSYTVTNLKAGDIDTFRVEAIDAANQKIPGSALFVTMLPAEPPSWLPGSAITDTLVTETGMTIRWPVAQDQCNEIKGYSIFLNGKFVDLVKTNQYPFTGFEEGTFYNFGIVAYDESNSASDTLRAQLSTLPSHIAMPLVKHPANQKNPDVSDRYVVWEDDRNDDGDIYAYDLETDSVIRITTDQHKQFEPKVSGDRIVWTDTRNGGYDIYMWDPWNGEAAVCTATGDQYMPAIDGYNIVWTDFRNGNSDIYMYNWLAKQEVSVVTRSSNQNWPDIEGVFVVYTDDRNGNMDIYMTNIQTHEEYPIVVKRYDQTHPSISRAIRKYPQLYQTLYITYEDQGDIYLYAPFYLDGEGYRTVLPVDEGIMWTVQSLPRYESKQLVYVDDKPFNDGIHHSVYVYKFGSNSPSSYSKIKIVGSESGADQTNPRIYADIIVWQYTIGTDYDIYIWKRPPGADLQLTVTESADPVPAGDTLRYYLALNNDGPFKSVPASVECTIPAEAIFVSATSGKGIVTVDGLKIKWDIDSLVYGSEDTMKISMLTSGDCILTFNATATTQTFDPDPSNNKVTETTKVKTITPRAVDEGLHAGMLVEPDGKVHLVYRKGNDESKDGDLMYASKTRSGKWEFHKIGTCPPYVSGFFQLAMTSDGAIHVIYSNQDWTLTPKSRLYHGILTPDMQWQSKIIAVSDSAFLSPALAVKSDDELCVAYIKAFGLNGTVMIKNTSNGSWQDAKKIGGGYCSVDIATDGADNLHLCTYDVNLGIIYYRVLNGIPGPPEQVEPGWKGGQKEGLFTSIMTDKMNRPHISYVGQVNNDNRENTKHAWKENSVWFSEKIDRGEYFSSISKVVSDPFNAVNLGYNHLPTHKTRFASNFSGPWIKLPIDGGINDLAMDASGNGHMIMNSIDYVFIPPLDYIKAEPGILDFEVVQPGASRTLSLVLSNPALKEIRIDSIKTADERFTVDKTAFVLEGFTSDTVKVTFTQNSTGAKADDLLSIIYNCPTGLIMEIPLKAASLAPQLNVEEETVDIGTVPLNSTATKTVTLKNTGANDLIFSNINVKYELFPGIPWALDFQLSGHNCSTLHYGEKCQVEVSFSPTTEGDQFSYLNIYSNDPEKPVRQIMLTGRSAYASIIPDKTSMNFGYCETGQSKKDTLLIRNDGGAMLTVSGVTITGTNKELFSVINFCQNIQPGDSCIIPVAFAPVSGGDFQADLVVNSNSLYAKTLTIPLAGSSLRRNLTLSDSQIVFGEIPVGHKASFMLSLSNTGPNDITINDIRVSGIDMYEFSQGCASLLCSVLQPGITCIDTVYFTPLFEGEKSASLVVSSNDSQKPVQTVLLTGRAILNNNSISGMVWDETGLQSISKSQVSLIPGSDIQDTTLLLLNGSNNFHFGGLPSGKFTVLALPDPVEYPDDLPTYYGDNILLSNALWIQTSGDLTGKDIRLVKKPVSGAGSGVISGSLVTGSSKGISVTEKTGDIKGSPLPGVYVYLKRASDGRLMAFDITDPDGGFIFQGLEDGSYIFLADYRGRPMDPANPSLTISSGRKEIEILATAGIETITITDLTTGIYLSAEAAISIYPVPASERITIQIPEGIFSGNSIRLRIADPSGRHLYINEFSDFHGNSLTIGISGMKEGLYIIELGAGEVTIKSRFIIIR